MQGNQIPLVLQSPDMWRQVCMSCRRHVSSALSLGHPIRAQERFGTQLVLTDGRRVKVTIMVWNIQLCLGRTSHYLRMPECPVQLYNCLFDFIHRAYYWINDPAPPAPPFLVPKMFVSINPEEKRKEKKGKCCSTFSTIGKPWTS